MKLKMLLYCTKAGLILRDYRGKAIFDRFVLSPTDRPFTTDDRQPVLNGKIVAECDFEVEEITHGYGEYGEYYQTKTLGLMSLREHSCISSDELSEYLKHGDVVSKVGYAIHIKNLNVFDKPKKLIEFEKVGSYNNPTIKCKGKERGRCNHGISPFTGKLVGCLKARLTKAPQNMCYVQDIFGNKYVVISVHPEWLCLILNGKKDVELRRKVLKEMKE